LERWTDIGDDITKIDWGKQESAVTVETSGDPTKGSKIADCADDLDPEPTTGEQHIFHPNRQKG
jgi:hypothetical protein